VIPLQLTGKALGSEIEITIVANSAADVKSQLNTIWLMILDFEKKYSRFLPMSELSDFNRSAGLNTPVSPEFMKLLRTVKQQAVLSRGLFNPFVLPAVQKEGYIASFLKGYEKDESDNFSSRHVASINELVLSEKWARIPSDTALDFGGIGKGYLADQLANELNSNGFTNYWISLGGDIVCEGFDEHGQPWDVLIENAWDHAGVSGHIAFDGSRKAIATSTTTKRRGMNHGKTWHHLIDPRTTKSAVTNISMATTISSLGVLADVSASCLVIAGSAKAQQVLDWFNIDDALLHVDGSKGKKRLRKHGNLIRTDKHALQEA
jgi:thiamine biosynthesis lipoprotein